MGQIDPAGSTWNCTLWLKRLVSGTWQASASAQAPPVSSTQGFIYAPVLRMIAAGAGRTGSAYPVFSYTSVVPIPDHQPGHLHVEMVLQKDCVG